MKSKKKKVRGQQRKLSKLLRQIDALQVPIKGNEDMRHYHVPGDDWIGMRKTSGRMKTAFCRRWIAKTEEFTRQMEGVEGFCKVVGLISYPDLSGSQGGVPGIYAPGGDGYGFQRFGGRSHGVIQTFS